MTNYGAHVEVLSPEYLDGIDGGVAGAEVERPGRAICLEREKNEPNIWWARQFSNLDAVKAQHQTAEEILERLRLGIFVLIREGEVRRELEAVIRIKDENIDLSRLALSTDSVGPEQLIRDGYMEYVVQKAIDLGFDPITAIKMVTINPARYFALDHVIGGITPGRFADIVIIPDLHTVKAEYVISNGKVVTRDGQLLVQPAEYTYPGSMYHSVR